MTPMVTYSVASCVMLLKVNGANVLMLLLLRSLRRCKRTVSAHGQTNSRTLCIYACSASRRLHWDARDAHSVQGQTRATYTSDSCFRAASSLGTDVSMLPSKYLQEKRTLLMGLGIKCSGGMLARWNS